VLSCIKA